MAENSKSIFKGEINSFLNETCVSSLVKDKEKITSLTEEINIEVENFIDFLKNNLPKLEKSSFSIGKETNQK